MLHFVLPDHADRPTGGNLYNHYLRQGLKALGIRTSACSLPIYQHTRPDSADIYLVDSLFVNDLAPALQPVRAYFLLHALPSMLGPANTAQRLREAEVLRQFTGIICTSPLSQAYVQHTLGVDRPTWSISPACAWVPSSKPPPVDTVRALMVANLVPNKGVLTFLKALADQADQLGDLMLTLIGREDMDPSYAQQCLNLVRAVPALHQRVRYLGAVPHAELIAHYQAANLLVSASTFETFGMALHEARVMGLPILALGRGYVAHHIKDSHTGRVFNSVGALATGLIDLVRYPAHLHLLYRGAWADRPDSYTWEDAAHRLLEVIGITVSPVSV